jgi:hypothetical protein
MTKMFHVVYGKDIGLLEGNDRFLVVLIVKNTKEREIVHISPRYKIAAVKYFLNLKCNTLKGDSLYK